MKIEEELIDVDEHEVQEVLDKLDSHRQILDTHDYKINIHDGKIQTLETNTSVLKEKMTNLEGIVTRFEANSYQTQNNMMQLLSQVIVNTSNSSVEIVKNVTKNEADVIKNNDTNRTTVIIKVLGIVGAVVTGVFLAKYGVSIPAIM